MLYNTGMHCILSTVFLSSFFMMEQDGTTYFFKQVHVPLRKDTLLKAAVICLNDRNAIVAEYVLLQNMKCVY